MKVVTVNAHDIQGGAAKAAYRLHKALIAKKIDSTLLVQFKFSDDFTVEGPQTMGQKIFARIRNFVGIFRMKMYKNKRNTLFSSSKVPFTDVAQRINKLKPDIVHLHWVNAGFLDIKDLVDIEAPIVWTLHDDWPITGGCHIKWDCEKYKEKCGDCPVLNTGRTNDLSSFLFDRKIKYVPKVKNLTLIAVSRWLQECALNSPIYKGRNIVVLPNLIDMDVFSHFDKAMSRQLLKLPSAKRLILFGAMNATDDINKGFSLLLKALEHVPTQDVELVIFGSSNPAVPPAFKHKAHYMGQLHDEISLKLIYNAADVMVVPSIQESFGQTAAESMSCGTPVVAFATTGLTDIVDHKVNGYLAVPYDVNDLAEGISWVLYQGVSSELREASIDKVKRCFSSDVVVDRYIELYEQIVNAAKYRSL